MDVGRVQEEASSDRHLQSGSCCYECLKSGWLVVRRPGQDGSHRLGCSRACPHGIQTLSHEETPCACCGMSMMKTDMLEKGSLTEYARQRHRDGWDWHG